MSRTTPRASCIARWMRAFGNVWQATHRANASIRQSHGGSGSQARSVIDGLEADVVTLALAYDIDAVAKAGLIEEKWQARLPEQQRTVHVDALSSSSARANPKGIRDWADLVKPGVAVVTPNPKTSGGARWNYLAAWGYAVRQPEGSEDGAASIRDTRSSSNVPVLDSGARGATNTFVQRQIGDVLLAWENEAHLALAEAKDSRCRDDRAVGQHPGGAANRGRRSGRGQASGTREAAEAYLQFLYTPEGQELAAKHHYRPRDPQVAAKYAGRFAGVRLFTIDEVFGGWAEGAGARTSPMAATFDQIYSRVAGDERQGLCSARATGGTHCIARLPDDAGLHDPVSDADRVDSAGRPVPADGVPELGGLLADGHRSSRGAIVQGDVHDVILAASVNGIFGFIVAWVLVRDTVSRA